MGKYETVIVAQSGEVITVTLNRPNHNPFNEKMVEELIQIWHSLRSNTSARFVILAGHGDHFSVGIDLKALGSGDVTPEDARLQQLAGQEMMRSLESLEQVTVAALQGIVCGAGMAIAQACDFRIMAEDSYFLLPETNIGAYYTWGSTPRLVRMVGASKAMEIIMTCDPVSAEEAYRLNLANKVVPVGTLMKDAQEFVAKIAKRGPGSIRITKKIVRGAAMEGLGNMLIPETELIQGLVQSGETEEGISAFLEKREPKFD
ncbi:MAG: enoyl-CoA hydratase/isomerase family protein [Proteobacteria bacterium]|nr:enoyl-CoA hydratase/isomerase family protein [Pseudomonadota bacterium]